MNRREAMQLLGAFLAIPIEFFGSTSDAAPSLNTTIQAPQLTGLANFSGAWSSDVQETVEDFAAAPLINSGLAEFFSSTQFSNSDDIERYFRTHVSASFIDWFNQTLSYKNSWAKKAIKGDHTAENFKAFWNEFLSVRPCTVMEFIAYMSIFINECAGNLTSIDEGYGYPGHNGISYLFDKISVKKSGKTFTKRSYNEAPNRISGALFDDGLFNQTHGKLPLGKALRSTSDPVWAGTLYPAKQYSTSGDPKITGYILEADFFKFRGRGVVQTTWRTNYIPLVAFIQNYSGSNPILLTYKNNWSGKTGDEVCTLSTNNDWDTLFGDTRKTILCETVRAHAAGGHYMPLSHSTDGINAGTSVKGSIGFMGLRIGGGYEYAKTFQTRVGESCSALFRAIKTGN